MELQYLPEIEEDANVDVGQDDDKLAFWVGSFCLFI